MKKILFAFFLLGSVLSYFAAGNSSDTGVVLALGYQSSFTDKARDRGVQAAGDYNFRHSWTVLPPLPGGKLPVVLDLSSPGCQPVRLPVVELKPEKISRARNVARKGTRLIKNDAVKTPVKGRRKRVSRLQDPGEALGGGVSLDLPAKIEVKRRKK